MFLRSRTNSVLFVAVLLLTGIAGADTIAEKVSVTDPYVRAVPPVVKTSAAFMQMQYSGPQEEFLVAAETPLAGAVELHMHEHDDGVMRMRRIPHIHLPPGKTVSLEPGGLHIMLFDLQGSLAEGDTVPITLIFADDSRKSIDAPVKPAGHMMKH